MRYLEGELEALRDYMNIHYKGGYVVSIEEVGGFPKIRIRVERFHILVTRFSMAQYRIIQFYQLTKEQKEFNKECNLCVYREAEVYEANDFKGVVEKLNELRTVLDYAIKEYDY